MREIKASEFKAKCLKLIDEVAATGEAIVITKRGKAVARVEREPKAAKSLAGLLGCMKRDLEPVDPNDNLFSVWTEQDTRKHERKLERIARDLAAPGRRRASKRR